VPSTPEDKETACNEFVRISGSAVSVQGLGFRVDGLEFQGPEKIVRAAWESLHDQVTRGG